MIESFVIKFTLGILFLGVIIFAARGLAYAMDKIIRGRYSFWCGFLLSCAIMAVLLGDPEVMDLPNDTVVVPALIYSMPHYVLIGLAATVVSVRDSDFSFLQGLSDEIGHYMLMVSIAMALGTLVVA